MITKKSLVEAVQSKVKPISKISSPWGWPQSVTLSSADIAELKDKKVGDEISFNGKGVIRSNNDRGDFTIEIQKIG